VKNTHELDGELRAIKSTVIVVQEFAIATKALQKFPVSTHYDRGSEFRIQSSGLWVQSFMKG